MKLNIFSPKCIVFHCIYSPLLVWGGSLSQPLLAIIVKTMYVMHPSIRKGSPQGLFLELGFLTTCLLNHLLHLAIVHTQLHGGLCDQQGYQRKLMSTTRSLRQHGHSQPAMRILRYLRAKRSRLCISSSVCQSCPLLKQFLRHLKLSCACPFLISPQHTHIYATHRHFVQLRQRGARLPGAIQHSRFTAAASAVNLSIAHVFIAPHVTQHHAGARPILFLLCPR